MYVNGEYTHFSLTDVNRFERWMRKWCLQVCQSGRPNSPSRAMLVFDKYNLKVEGKSTNEVKDNQVFHHLILPNITLQYIFINENMCVLIKVWENVTLSVLYSIPDRWHNVEVWHAT